MGKLPTLLRFSPIGFSIITTIIIIVYGNRTAVSLDVVVVDL